MSLLNATFSAARTLRSSRVVGQQLRSMSMINLGGEPEIEKFRMINSKSILMFTATWCPPCKVIKPVYQKLAEENSDVAFGLVDIDENEEAALEFEINAVPTFVFFDGKKAVNRMPGADGNQLVKLLDDLKAR